MQKIENGKTITVPVPNHPTIKLGIKNPLFDNTVLINLYLKIIELSNFI